MVKCRLTRFAWSGIDLREYGIRADDELLEMVLLGELAADDGHQPAAARLNLESFSDEHCRNVFCFERGQCPVYTR